MTRLRKMMLEELQRRNFSRDTIRHYSRTVEDFARHFNRPPDRLPSESKDTAQSDANSSQLFGIGS